MNIPDLRIKPVKNKEIEKHRTEMVGEIAWNDHTNSNVAEKTIRDARKSKQFIGWASVQTICCEEIYGSSYSF